MSKKYFVMKDPFCRIEEVEWIELSGREFYRFIKAPENQDRYFIDMGNVMLESTKDAFCEHKKEANRRNYLNEQKAGWETISLFCLERDKKLSGEEIIADETQDVEATAILSIRRRALRKAMRRLSPTDHWIIELKYGSAPMSEEKIGSLIGLTQSGVSRRLTSIKTFLKKIVIELEKSQQ